MRAKGSEEYLALATAFANAITIQARTINSVIECRGSRSIFAALTQSTSGITRRSDSASCKGAISEIEMNKVLRRSGFTPHRVRSRIKGTTNQWTKGVILWMSRRWVDPSSEEEMLLMQTQLADLQSRYPSIKIDEQNLFDFLTTVSSNQADDLKNNYSSMPELVKPNISHPKYLATSSSLDWHRVPSIPHQHFTPLNRCGNLAREGKSCK